ncbi:MAG: fumarate reductase subunit D [Pseudohongiellaceae bacterium]|jgi:fumarate reductase subunit D
MIFRLILLIGLPIAAYYFVKSSSNRFNLSARQTRYLYFFVVALLVIGILIVLGRLPVQFILAPIGVAATYLFRMLPMLLRLLPMWQMFKSRVSSSAQKSAASVSKIKTGYLAMTLDHDGEVVKGKFAGSQLSALVLAQLLELAAELAADSDSAQVFEAYMDRSHPDWREGGYQSSAQAGVQDSAEMTAQLAYEILGLQPSASKDEITHAHRSLMQKMHPDRGGSDYLAKKINLAKDFLLAKE